MSRYKHPISAIASLFMAAALNNCGIYVPEIQEPGENSLSGQQFVNSIIFNVQCEVRDAFVQLNYDYPQGTFMDDWGAQITLNLQVDEKSSGEAMFNWVPPGQSNYLFNLGFGATASAGATRIDKINWFVAVADVQKKEACNEQRPKGIFLLQSDLRLKEWIYDAITASKTRNIDFSNATATGPFKESVLSHEVKFVASTSGYANPGWKLTRFQVNQGGNGLTLSRDRTHDLTITLGPAIATKVASNKTSAQRLKLSGPSQRYSIIYSPSQQIINSHLASEIGLAVSNNIRSNAINQ